MYNSIIKEYEEKITKIKEERDLNRERIKAANLKLTNQILNDYNENAKSLKENEIELNYKIENLIEKNKKVEQKSQYYVNMYNEVNSHFKEVGDLVNFLEKIEGKLVNMMQNENNCEKLKIKEIDEENVIYEGKNIDLDQNNKEREKDNEVEVIEESFIDN